MAKSAAGSPRLLLGPMLGAPLADSIEVWAMASGPYPVIIEYADNPAMTNAKVSPSAMAGADEAFIVRCRLTGLRPATRYWYRVQVGGKLRSQDERPGQFRTAPVLSAREAFALGFGSCANYRFDPVQPIWTAIADYAPDFFLNLGDNIYADAIEAFVLDFEYQRQRGLPNVRPVIRDIPQIAVWDDHDFGLNDHDRTNPVKDAALAAFKRYWANPSYGLPDAPGVFFSLSYGAVDLFCTDGRYYRDPNEAADSPAKTFLGARQKAWLKDELKKSRAVFKVLACGSGWTKNKGPVGDAWSACLHERDELFDFICDEKITGVVLISGDTHIGEFNCVPWSERGGYDLFEIVSSPLANAPSDSWLQRQPELRLRKPYTAGSNFGLLSFDFAGEPTVRADIIDPAGRRVWPTAELKLGQLRNGVSSWRDYGEYRR